jgi:hypothetical protein
MSVEDLRRLAIDAGRQDDPKVLNLLEAVALTGDRGLHEQARLMLQNMAAKQQARRDAFFPYPPPEAVKGPIVIGEVEGNGAPVGLHPVELGQGAFLAGQSGSGKTGVQERILPQFVELGGIVTVFDFKSIYGHLPRYLPDCAVMTLGDNCMINVLETPLKGLEAIYRRTMGLFTSGEFTFRSLVTQLLDHFDTHRVGACPSVADLSDYAQSLKYKPKSDEERDHKRLLKRLGVMAESLGEMARVRKGITPDQLLSHNLVIRPGSLPSDVMEFMVECIIYQCFAYRLERGEKMAWKNLIVLDEATTVFSAKKDRLEGQAYSEFVNLASKGREYGLQFLAGSQLPQYCSPAALGNSYVKLLLPCGHGDDYLVMARAMGMDQQQLAESHRLKQEHGNWQGILKLSGRWTRPMRIRLSPSGLDRDVTVGETHRLSRPVLERLAKGVVYGPPADLSGMRQSLQSDGRNARGDRIVSDVKNEGPAEDAGGAPSAPRKAETILPDAEQQLLLDINERPLLADFERTGFRANELRRAKKGLARRQLITVEKCITGMRCGTLRLPQLTKEGAETIRRLGRELRAPLNWVGHRYLVSKLETRFQADGTRVLSREFHEANGNITDMVIVMEGGEVAVEVQTNGRWDASYAHLGRLLDVYDRILLVAPRGDLRAIRKGLQKNLADDVLARIRQKVRFCELGQLLSKIMGENTSG